MFVKLRLVLGGMLTVPAVAGAAVTIDCPADGTFAAMSLSYEAEALSVTDATGTATLPASLREIAPDMFAITGSGPMDALMPEPGALDACLAAELADLGATVSDADALGYAANLCRLNLSAAGTVQTIEARFEITALEPKAATVFIQRQYSAPSPLTGAPVQLAEFPLRNCVVLSGP